MSKLHLGHNIKNFINKGKLKLSSFIEIDDQDKIEKAEDIIEDIRDYIINNIKNITTINKNEDNSYSIVVTFHNNSNNTTNNSPTMYDISYEDALELGIVDILEEKLNNMQKSK